MRARRFISLLNLLSFLPFAVGCSVHKTESMFLESDPDSASVIPDSDEPVRIIGYNLRADGFHEWDGYVHAAPPDFLVFSSEKVLPDVPADGSSTFRLLRADVLSLRVKQLDHYRIKLGVVASLCVVALVALPFIMFAASDSQWN